MIFDFGVQNMKRVWPSDIWHYHKKLTIIVDELKLSDYILLACLNSNILYIFQVLYKPLLN